MPGTYIVTGAAGFIGSNFVRMALERDDIRIVALDKLTYAGNLANLADVGKNPAFEFVKGDIADGRLVKKFHVRKRFTVVVEVSLQYSLHAAHHSRYLARPRR